MRRQTYLCWIAVVMAFSTFAPGSFVLASDEGKGEAAKESTYKGKWVHPITLNNAKFWPIPSRRTHTISYFTKPKGDYHFTIGEILGNKFYFHKTFVTGEKHVFTFNLDTNEVEDVDIKNGEGQKYSNKYRIWSNEAEEFVAALKKVGDIKKS